MTKSIPVSSDSSGQARRILVCGGRDYADRERIADVLREYAGVLVHGGAPGADSLAAEWWRKTCGSRNVETHNAQWLAPCRDTCAPGHRRRRRGSAHETYCPAAGVYRNQEMLDSGVDLVVAFPGGTGTADMVQRAKDAGVQVRLVAG